MSCCSNGTAEVRGRLVRRRRLKTCIILCVCVKKKKKKKKKNLSSLYRSHLCDYVPVKLGVYSVLMFCSLHCASKWFSTLLAVVYIYICVFISYYARYLALDKGCSCLLGVMALGSWGEADLASWMLDDEGIIVRGGASCQRLSASDHHDSDHQRSCQA